MKLGQMLFIPIMLATALLASCGDDDGDGATTGQTTTTTGTTTTTTTTTTGGGDQVTRVQLAHLSPDAPSVDFCAQREGRSFLGPIAKELLGDSDAVAFGDVTGYAPLPGGKYTLRFVAADATTCDDPISGIPDVEDVTLDPQQRTTFAVIGALLPAGGARPLRVVAIKGDAAPNQASARLRAFHAVPEAGPVDVGRTTNGTVEELFSGVAFGDLGKVNGDTYRDVPPAMDARLSVQASGAEILALPGVDLAPGAVTTVYIAGNALGSPQALRGIVCSETPEQPDFEPLANCTALP